MKISTSSSWVEQALTSLEETADTSQLIVTLKEYDDITYKHSLSVSKFAIVIGSNYGLQNKELFDLAEAGILHDIGKIRVDKKIIGKHGKLTKTEFEEIKNHPLYGYDLMKQVDLSDAIKKGILQHHEKCSGNGYPNNLCEPNISLFGKMLSIADVYSALTSERPYKNALSSVEAIKIMRSDSSFNSELLNLLIKAVY